MSPRPNRHLCVGAPVRVIQGHYANLRGAIIAIHDSSVRDRRFDVQFTDRRGVFCFLRKEIEVIQ
jgi:hypothetical protein